jgi:hypothetical protein
VAGAVTVNSGGQLFGGNGATLSAVTLNSGGILWPGQTTGSGIGTLNLTALTWVGGTIKIDLGAGGTSDLLAMGSFINGSPGAKLTFDFQDTGVYGTNYTIATFTSQTGFTSSSFQAVGLAPGATGTFILDSNSLAFTAIPEPSTYAAIVAVVVLAAGIWHRRRRVVANAEA